MNSENELTLPLHLYADKQSWGGFGARSIRASMDFHTKSGLVGLMGAALGIPRDGDFSSLLSLKFATRLDREGSREIDYQTSRKMGKEDAVSDQTWREYLIWYGFTAFVSGSAEVLWSVYEAFQAPKFASYLGRKNCQPAVDICPVQPLSMPLEGALEDYWPDYTDPDMRRHQFEIDEDRLDQGVLRSDEPRRWREFSQRTVKVGYVTSFVQKTSSQQVYYPLTRE